MYIVFLATLLAVLAKASSDVNDTGTVLASTSCENSNGTVLASTSFENSNETRRIFGLENLFDFKLDVIDNIIKGRITDITNMLKKKGLDPLVFPNFSIKHSFPEPRILSYDVILGNITVTGLSNIVPETVNYYVMSANATLNLVIPKVEISVDPSSLDATVFGIPIAIRTQINVTILKPRFNGYVRMHISFFKPTVEAVNMHFHLEGLNIVGVVKVQQYDLSPLLSSIEEFLNDYIEYIQNRYRARINEMTSIAFYTGILTYLK